MPVQRTLFGRPIGPIHPRKLAILLASVALFALFSLLFTLPSSIPAGPSLSKFTAGHIISLPKFPKAFSPNILTVFRPAAHAPPVQKNSTSGDVSWYSNWSWLTPFSSSVTLDENRSILPPLRQRPPIYTYYDRTVKRDQEMKNAEDTLLFTWRRAWWAQGFKPIILGPAEAVNSPFYAELQMKNLEIPLKNAIMRWLAWESMGNGILCETLVFPMGDQTDHLLAYLRRGEYPKLARFDKLGRGLFTGSKTDVMAAIKQALANPELKLAKDFISAVDAKTFYIDPEHGSLAYYSESVVKERYGKLAAEISQDGPNGLITLNKLINAHMHVTWQNMFPKGIAVLKPKPKHMNTLVEPAHKLAEFLAYCPESPLPASCPPNHQRCSPCVSTTPMVTTTPYTYRNTTGLYTIGTVPHPYTMAVFTQLRSNIDIPWIRRVSNRDEWLSTITKELLGNGVSGAPRISKFKEIVASPHGTSHTLWIPAEKDMATDLGWTFGFTIPRNATNGHSETPVPGPERRPIPVQDAMNGLAPSNPEEIEKEMALMTIAKEFGKARTESEEKVKNALEAWNLADTEAWRFVRAFMARQKMEREQWEEEEKAFLGG
ncbi:hypothetical protein BJ878DRAFT_452105 [Calycina marina]|uniref:Uncharacterized protein n=1 Tax=Calycina marina TaxID=1763456 RepID=A0A9P7ZAP5_9HELO|nr:hypothetical protein BJ878DRAFT_452105 [Calycina marina]